MARYGAFLTSLYSIFIHSARSRKKKKQTLEQARNPLKSIKKPTTSKPRRKSRTLHKSEPLPSESPQVLSSPIHQIPPKFRKSQTSNKLPQCTNIYIPPVDNRTALDQLVQSNKTVRAASPISWTTDEYLDYFANRTPTPERYALSLHS